MSFVKEYVEAIVQEGWWLRELCLKVISSFISRRIAICIQKDVINVRDMLIWTILLQWRSIWYLVNGHKLNKVWVLLVLSFQVVATVFCFFKDIGRSKSLQNGDIWWHCQLYVFQNHVQLWCTEFFNRGQQSSVQWCTNEKLLPNV